MNRTTSSIRTFQPSSQHNSDDKSRAAKKPKGFRRAVFAGWVKRRVWVLLLLVCIVAVVTVGVNLYNGRSTGGQYYFADQTARLNKLMPLPQNETPTIITVKDATQLRSQEFYKQAQNDDLVFVYKKAQRAILYRPSSNQIINVMPVKVN